MTFKPAKPSPFQRIALVGPSGSGKSYSALALARGRTALLSLEGPLKPPCQPVDWRHEYDLTGLLTGLREAREAGYSSVVVDCLSTLWSGPKGLLTALDRFDDKRGWSLIRQDLEALWEVLASYPGHVFCTFRAEELKVIQEREGQHRVVSLPGKVAFQGDFGSHFDVILEMSGGVADCKKGPPAAYGRLFPFPGAELAGLLFLPVSASQASPPAAEIASPQEAVAETTAHPLDPGQPAPLPRSSAGISTPPSAPKPTGQSEEAATIKRIRLAAVAAYEAGVERADIHKLLVRHGGGFDAQNRLTRLAAGYQDMVLGELIELTLQAKARKGGDHA